MDEDCISANCATAEERTQLQGTGFALSGIFGPDGEAIGDLLLDKAGLVVGDIDLERELTGKLMHDIVGHYNQPAILSLHLDARRPSTLHFVCREHENAETPDSLEE